MINFLIKIIFIYCFFLSSLSAEIIKKFEISGNKRISDETIIIFSEVPGGRVVSIIKRASFLISG